MDCLSLQPFAIPMAVSIEEPLQILAWFTPIYDAFDSSGFYHRPLAQLMQTGYSLGAAPSPMDFLSSFQSYQVHLLLTLVVTLIMGRLCQPTGAMLAQCTPAVKFGSVGFSYGWRAI